jgi:hypothetical protein
MANPLARLWTDVATIKRQVKYRDSNDISEFSLQTVATDVPCRVSWNVKVPRTDATIVQRTDMEARLFFPPGTDIHTGDEVHLDRNGNKYIFQEISISQVYSRHIQVNCKAQQKRA